MSVNEVSFLALLVLGTVCGCAPREPGASSESLRAMEAQIAEGQRRSEIARTFSVAHQSNGQDARTFVSMLRKEGFACRLQYQKRYSAGTGENLGKFSASQVPGLECVTTSYEPRTCQEFRVSIGLEVKDPKRDLKLLANELSEARVLDALSICERTRLDIEVLEEGIRRGLIVPLGR